MKTLLLSDTHGQHYDIDIPKKGYTCVIHTGDFTNMGREDEIDSFLLWYSNIPCKHKILIAGNHDLSLEYHNAEFKQKCHILGITYLYNESVTINEIKIYGTPHIPMFYDWAFMNSEKQLREIYSKIPDDTNVLLTHGPALWILDEVPRGHVGSEALLEQFARLKQLKYHIFGHIHEDGGKETTIAGCRHLNVSCMDMNYDCRKPKIINIKGN